MSEPAESSQRNGKPVILSVLDVASGAHDQCTPGGAFVVRGRGFGASAEPSWDMGVYVHGPGATLQRIGRYERWSDNEIRGYWPPGITGPVWLFVETHESESQAQSAIHCSPVMLSGRIES